MKISIAEYDVGFHIDMEAETVQDAAILARLGMNNTKERGWVQTLACRDSMSATVCIGIRKDHTSNVRRGR